MADSAVTAANVLKSGNGQFQRGLAAVALTAGKVIYQLANGKFGLADSNGVAPANSVAGIACNSAPGVDQPVDYVQTDTAFVTGATLTSGAVVYLSDTPGGFTTDYTDIASGSTVIILGVVNTDGSLNFNPVVGGVK